MEDFAATGMVSLAKQPLYRKMDDIEFKTPSGKIELIHDKLETQGLFSLKPYEPPRRPPEGQFRITFGRCAVNTQGHTVNNPLLHEQMPETGKTLPSSMGAFPRQEVSSSSRLFPLVLRKCRLSRTPPIS
jgi:hypothetical protein